MIKTICKGVFLVLGCSAMLSSALAAPAEIVNALQEENVSSEARPKVARSIRQPAIDTNVAEDIDVFNEEIVMYSGEARVFNIGPVNRVAIGNGKIATTAVIDKTKLLVIAQEAGLTNILIWKKPKLSKEIRIRVTALNVLKQYQEVSDALREVEGVSVVRRADRIYAEGEVSNPGDYMKVASIASQYANLVNNVQVTAGPGAPLYKRNSQMLIFDLYFVEFKKGYLESVGVSWAKSFNGFNVGVFGEAARGDLLVRPFPSETSLDVGQLPPVRQTGVSASINALIAIPAIIRAAVDTGDAYLLASPSIATRNGGQARFVSGGEVPIPTVSQNGTNVTFKPYGILIELAPKIDDMGNINGVLKAEVSNVDRSVSVGGVPGFTTRKTETDFSVKTGDAIVLSGLYNQSSGKDVEKVPLLGDIPLLGAMFRATNTSSQETEVYLIAVPHYHDGEKMEDSQALRSLGTRVNDARARNGDLILDKSLPTIRDRINLPGVVDQPDLRRMQ